MAKIDWVGLTREMERLLHLKASPVAYKRLEKVEELDKISEVMRPFSGAGADLPRMVEPSLTQIQAACQWYEPDLIYFSSCANL